MLSLHVENFIQIRHSIPMSEFEPEDNPKAFFNWQFRPSLLGRGNHLQGEGGYGHKKEDGQKCFFGAHLLAENMKQYQGHQRKSRG